MIYEVNEVKVMRGGHLKRCVRQFDTIVIEENIVPQADHWVRQRDLQRILRGQDTGHQIVEMLNADRTLRIEMTLEPFPQLIIEPPQQGRRQKKRRG